MTRDELINEIIRIQQENKQGVFIRVCSVDELRKLSTKDLENTYRIAKQFDY